MINSETIVTYIVNGQIVTDKQFFERLLAMIDSLPSTTVIVNGDMFFDKVTINSNLLYKLSTGVSEISLKIKK